MKRVYLLASMIFYSIVSYSQAGQLDSSFGTNGIVKNDTALYFATAIQHDGKIVAAGISDDEKNFTLARYNTNGSLDSSFSEDGYQTVGINSSKKIIIARPVSIAIQDNGKIVVAGNVRINGSYLAKALIRCNIDGTLDGTFSKDGQLLFDDPASNTYTNSMAIQTDGKIIVAGYGYNGGNQDFILTRFNVNGSLDKTFGENGKQTTDFDKTDDYAYSVSIQTDGKIVAAGFTENGIHHYFALARYNTDGSPDNTFSGDGKQTTDFGTSAHGYALCIQSDNKIIVAGQIFNESVDFAIARYNIDGSLDNTFSDDGKQTTRFDDESMANANSIAIQNDGKIVVGGEFKKNNSMFSDFALARFNTDGSLDDSFSGDGKQISDGSQETKSTYIYSIATWNNKLYASGILRTEIPSTSLVGIVSRYLLDSENNTAPTVTLTSPTNNSIRLAPAAHIKLSATATDIDGSITKVEFYNGNTLLHTEYVFPYGFVWRNVPLGNYTLTAKTTDNSGLVTTSEAVHISVVPNKPPTVSIIAPANNEHYADPGYIHFEAAASDTDGTIKRVEFYNGSTLLRIEYKYPYTYVWKGIPVGTYVITAVATDNWGAQTTSAPIIVKVVPENRTIVSSKPSVNNKTNLNISPSLKLYPNPANQTLNIYTKGLQQNRPATISIISVSGIVFKNIQINSSIQSLKLDVSELAKGVYTIKIISGDKVLYKQFVKL